MTSESTFYERTTSLQSIKSKKHLQYKQLPSNVNEVPLIENQPQKPKLFDFWNDWSQFRSLIFGNKLNLLLIFVPFGFISYYVDWAPTAIFFINFFAMIPVANILGDSTECLADHLGETIGGLLNATFGNAVEMVVMIMALAKAKSYKHAGNISYSNKLLVVVQSSLIGSIFSNSLLVLGCSFIANGIYYKESSFNASATSANVCLLLVSSFVMILPAPYSAANETHDELMVSRAAACVLLIMYACLLIFVLYTHKHLMEPEPKNVNGPKVAEMTPITSTQHENKNHFEDEYAHTSAHTYEKKDSKLSTVILKEELNSIENQNGDSDGDDDDDDDDLHMSIIGSLLLLLFTTILVSLLSEYLVDALEPMSEQLGMSEAFIGIILLPIIGNAVEHITSIRMAIKNKMDIAVSIAIGSATQVAMFVVSLSVLIAWAMDLDLALDFDSFEVNMFIYTSIIIFAITSDGHSNWLEGAMLICLYVLIGIAVWDQKFS